MNMCTLCMKKAELIQLWIDFGDIPINDNDEIETPYMFFDAGTDRFEIWHWFDEQYDDGVVQLMQDANDVMFGRKSIGACI